MATRTRDDVCEIRQVVENWALWRDAGDWERFASVWHDDGYMTTTWFQGPADEFIAASRKAFDSGVTVLHFLGGTAVDVARLRAIAQTKMTISQRDDLHGIEVDVVCTGRFYDFLERRDGQWKIVRRQPIYEKDRLDPVDPAATVRLDKTLLGSFPVGYRHLAYLQTVNGFDIEQGGPGLPGLRGDVVEKLYAEGRAWLDGSAASGTGLKGT